MNTQTSNAVKQQIERLRTSPVPWPRTARPDVFRTVTSGAPGKAVPLAFIPLDRNDAMETTRVQCRAYMEETSNLLLNTVNATFSAWLVPKLAFDRFDGSRDALDRAYMKKLEKDGSQIPWITTHNPTGMEIYQAAGLHYETTVNTDYAEAYDKIFEYRCKQRSEALWTAVSNTVGSGNLHSAFFDNPQMAIVKPSFDIGATEGVVPLTVVGGELPVKGISANGSFGTLGTQTYDSTGAIIPVGTPGASPGAGTWMTGKNTGTINTNNTLDIYAELQQDGITVSLANIEMAKKTQAWSRVRNQYSGIDDDDLIDLLMSGLQIPEMANAMPILIDRKKVPFGMTQRFSTESASLEVSATRGQTGTELKVRTPIVETGGVVVIMVEVVPEQFWERSKDYHLLSDNDTRLPDRLVDELDPQAVTVVTNDHADVAHSDPTGIFGYSPLNHERVRRRFNIGGKFYRSDPNALWDENRNRLWTSEPVDPTLSKEFYLATDLTEDIFLQQTVDNFEFSCAGDAVISGLTYIGPMLREASGDYQHILDRIDTARIESNPVVAADLAVTEEETVEEPVEEETPETPSESETENDA